MVALPRAGSEEILRQPHWLAGEAVLIARVSKQIPWYQGILQGILRFGCLRSLFGCIKPLCCSGFSLQFPTRIIRENNLENKEFQNGIRE